MNQVDKRLSELVQRKRELYNTSDKDIKNYQLRATSFLSIGQSLQTEFPEENFSPGKKKHITSKNIH